MIRIARSEDLNNIMNLLQHLSPIGTVCPEYVSTVFFKLEYNQNCTTLVWDLGDKIVGVGTLWVMQKLIRDCGRVGQIEDLVVDPDYEGCGFGKQMVNALVSKAREAHCYKIVLNCSDENIPFYEKCGFTKKESQMRMDI